MANMQERLEASVAQAEIDVSKFHNIVHGNDTAIIETENGAVPSVAKHLKDIKTEIISGAEATLNQAENDIDKLHQLVNGDENTVIETENGELSSLGKTLKEIKQDLTDGVDEIVGTALSAKEIILEAQADVTQKYGQITEIKEDIDTTKNNIEAINQNFENAIEGFETKVLEALDSVDNAKTAVIEVLEATKDGLVGELELKKDDLIVELQTETDTLIESIEANGAIQEQKALEQAERAVLEANRVSQPIILRSEASGNITIDWSLNEDYCFNLSASSSFSFSNLPTDDSQGNFKQLIIKALSAFVPSFPSNVSFAEASPPSFAANKTYQITLQYLAILDKVLACFVEY